MEDRIISGGNLQGLEVGEGVLMVKVLHLPTNVFRSTEPEFDSQLANSSASLQGADKKYLHTPPSRGAPGRCRLSSGRKPTADLEN